MRWGKLALLLACACGAPPREPEIDPEFDAAETTARDAFEAGRLSDAAQLYERALDRARAMDDPAKIGAAAYNLAICLVAADEFDRAADALAEAQLEFARASDTAGAADARVVAMRLAYRRGDTDTALALARETVGAEGHIVRGEIACDRNDPDGASTEAAAARNERRATSGHHRLAQRISHISRGGSRGSGTNRPQRARPSTRRQRGCGKRSGTARFRRPSRARVRHMPRRRCRAKPRIAGSARDVRPSRAATGNPRPHGRSRPTTRRNRPGMRGCSPCARI
ncbi:MAG: tetratricopeptide repeat protein [Planctomycetota bacterium]|jgi:hypothetical protein